MPQMQRARSGLDRAGAETAGEDVLDSVTDPTDKPAAAVPVWIRRRGGDPVIIRRRIAAALDDLLGIWSVTVDLDDYYDGDYYREAGLNLGVSEREAAAPAPVGCAA